MWVYYNPSPNGARVGDCAVRALCKALKKPWEAVYIQLMAKGLEMYDMPSSNAVWGAVLRDNGFVRQTVPNTCPQCYTLKDFCADHTRGVYVVNTGGHVVTCSNGNYFDTWDSGNENPIFFYVKEA